MFIQYRNKGKLMMKKNLQAFTLIELMIVLVIIGILMAYGIPSYQRYVIKSKRTEAQKTLIDIAGAQERHNAIYHQYATTLDAPEAAADLAYTNADTDNYTFAVSNTDGFTVSSTAISPTQLNDTFDGDCTSMSINAIGVKDPASCWD